MNRKELLAQCQKWHKQNEHQKIIDTLEEIPEKNRTREIDMELVQAYNSQAVFEQPVNRAMLKRAIELMQPYEDELDEDYSWNFRMGIAHYYLDQEGLALWHFEDALRLHPGDDPRSTSKEHIQELIDACKARLALPDFQENFRQRTIRAWETFAEREAELRRMMDENKIAEMMTVCSEILHIAFENIGFEIGVHCEKPELILTPEGDRVKLFELNYFLCHAPAEVLTHWDIRIGRPPMTGAALRSDDLTISDEDVCVWVEKAAEKTVTLTLYSEKLLPILRDDKDRALWAATMLVSNVVGEIPYMLYIAYVHIKSTPDKEPSIPIAELPKELEKMGFDLSIDAEGLLDLYTGYHLEPDNDPDAIWRMDVIAGSSNCIPLIDDYLRNEVYYINNLHADGTVAGFLCFPVDGFDGEDRTQKIFDFRDELQNYIEQKAGADAVTIIGGATGLRFCYVDFIAWDLHAVLPVAKEFFENSDLTWAGFHVFRQGPDYITLIDRDENGEIEPLANFIDEIEYLPYTPENAEAFYQQLEQWNDADEFTRCIKVLETIPEEQRDYRAAYALARALENYAVIGDHEHEIPYEECNKTLYRALEILESVRDEGEDKAEWNMRMAYAYQYLPEQEEQAIPYAERWAELDPGDEKAKEVIRECKFEIEVRNANTKSAFSVTLNLNARLQPMHRQELEDELNDRLESQKLGFVEGGGTMMMASGEIENCDIEITPPDGRDETIEKLVSVIEDIGVPKGSKLIWSADADERMEHPVGRLEGMAIYLNGTELPQEVYESCDINYAIEQLESRMDGIGRLYSWWEGPQNTALYFYGQSYEKMLAATQDFIAEYPLCQKCVIERIA